MNIHTIGVILMIAGAIGLVATLTVFAPRRGVSAVAAERTVTTAPAAAPVANPTVVTTTPAGVTTQQTVEHREVY